MQAAVLIAARKRKAAEAAGVTGGAGAPGSEAAGAPGGPAAAAAADVDQGPAKRPKIEGTA